MLDDFLKEKPPQLDLSESATNAERDEMPQSTLTPASTGPEAYAGNWRQEAEIFRQGIGMRNNNMMRQHHLEYVLGLLKAQYVNAAASKPGAPSWSDSLIGDLKEHLQRESQRVLEQTSDGKTDIPQNVDLEFIMLYMLERGVDVEMVDLVGRRLPLPVPLPDHGQTDLEDVAEVSLSQI